MDGFPLNTIVATTTAAATIFLGFLPTKSVHTTFYARESLKASLAWVFVLLCAPPEAFQYLLFLALFCFGSWWFFRADKMLRGKMWLSLASGLGISVGVMLVLGITPRAYPQAALAPLPQASLLASIYLGGITLGLAYVTYQLIHAQAQNPGFTDALIRRHAALLFFLVLARIPALFLGPLAHWHFFGLNPGPVPPKATEEQLITLRYWATHPVETTIVMVGVGLVLPILAGFIWRSPTHRRRGYLLLLFGTLALGLEILARILVL